MAAALPPLTALHGRVLAAVRQPAEVRLGGQSPGAPSLLRVKKLPGIVIVLLGHCQETCNDVRTTKAQNRGGREPRLHGSNEGTPERGRQNDRGLAAAGMAVTPDAVEAKLGESGIHEMAIWLDPGCLLAMAKWPGGITHNVDQQKPSNQGGA